MINKLRRILSKIPKPAIATALQLQSTTTIDMWTARGVVPVKYHAGIERLYNEFFK
jgi:hypothetical protein